MSHLPGRRASPSGSSRLVPSAPRPHRRSPRRPAPGGTRRLTRASRHAPADGPGRPRLARTFRALTLIPVLLGLVLMLALPVIDALGPVSRAAAQADPAPTAPAGGATEPVVHVIPIRGEIEPGIGTFLGRALDEAADAGATTVILDISTPGGRLDTVLEMRDAILDAPMETVALVNREAFSAGALITIAANQIWMTPGGVFGAATPVNGGTGETADAKVVSAVSATFRATAEERGRDALVAEAMVDTSVVVPELGDTAETLVSLSPSQAAAVGYLDGEARDTDDLIAQLGLAGASVTTASQAPIERLIRLVTTPGLATLLVMAGIFLVVADVFVEGFGAMGVVGLLLLGLFFFGHLLGGLAGWEDLLLIGLGVGLLAVEAFVLPGFGIAGIGGLVALGGGLFLTMTGRGLTDWGDVPVSDDVIRTAWMLVLAVGGAVVAGLLAGSFLSRLTGGPAGPRFGGGLALGSTVDGAGRPVMARPSERRAVPGGRRPGWVVRSIGGGSVLERDDRPTMLSRRPGDGSKDDPIPPERGAGS